MVYRARCVENVEFLGHVLSKEGIRKSEEFIEKVRTIVRPVTVKQMRRFLGLINFQRKFVKNCSLLTKPFSELMTGPNGSKIKWTEELDKRFEHLKTEVTEDVLLAYPDYDEQAPKLELYVDASGSGAGGCLMQKGNDGGYKVIGYA